MNRMPLFIASIVFVLLTSTSGRTASKSNDNICEGKPAMNMMELQRVACAERMIPNAPVQATSTITIDAPIAIVWAVATDVSRWPNWYDYLKNAQVQDGFVAGAKLSYGGAIKHDLAIAKVEDRRLAMIYGTMLGYSGVTRWDFKETAVEQTQVTFTESSEGFLIALLYSNEKLSEHLSDWLKKLKAEAERQAPQPSQRKAQSRG